MGNCNVHSRISPLSMQHYIENNTNNDIEITRTFRQHKGKNKKNNVNTDIYSTGYIPNVYTQNLTNCDDEIPNVYTQNLTNCDDFPSRHSNTCPQILTKSDISNAIND